MLPHLRLPDFTKLQNAPGRAACGAVATDLEMLDPVPFCFGIFFRDGKCPDCAAVALVMFNPDNLPPLADKPEK